MATASISTQEKRKGKNQTGRLSTKGPDAGGQVTLAIPPITDYIMIRNVGLNPCSFVFGSDVFTNAYDLPVGSAPITFGVNNGQNITLRSSGGAGSIQFIMWG